MCNIIVYIKFVLRRISMHGSCSDLNVRCPNTSVQYILGAIIPSISISNLYPIPSINSF